jgi:hypothetical protein
VDGFNLIFPMKNLISLSSSRGGLIAAPTTPVNNLVLQTAGVTQTGILYGNGASAANATDMTYATPTLSVVDAFNVSSAGSISLTAGGGFSGASPIYIPLNNASSSSRVWINGSGVATTSLLNATSVPELLRIDGGASGSTASAISLYGHGVGVSKINGLGEAGTAASPTAVTNNQQLLAVNSFGYAGTGTQYNNAASMIFYANEAFSATNGGGYMGIRCANIGGTTLGGDKFRFTGEGTFSLENVAANSAPWTTTGVRLVVKSVTITDTDVSGTAVVTTFNGFAAPTIAASGAKTYTDLFNTTFTAPVQGTNATITRKHTVGILDSTSAASSITGGFIVATTYGTAATSVGIGGGNINAGGTITSGGNLTVGTAVLGSAAAFTITGGAGNMTITAGTGASRTMTLQTTTSGSTATDALTINATQDLTYTATMRVSTDTLSGAGAVSVTKDTTKLTSTGIGQAITLANGTDGQIKRIIHDVDGGSMVLTPATKTGWSTATFTNAGDSLTLEYVTTRGWIVMGNYLTVVAP